MKAIYVYVLQVTEWWWLLAVGLEKRAAADQYSTPKTRPLRRERCKPTIATTGTHIATTDRTVANIQHKTNKQSPNPCHRDIVEHTGINKRLS